MSKKLKIPYFILAFIEGGAVMCVELCSAKLLSPVFGTSIYVWASVLGITLLALMSGYYLGGYLSSKNKKKHLIFWLMLLGGALVTLTPVISDLVLLITIRLNLILGSILSLFSFLFLPLLFFGATSPLLINYLTNTAKLAGKSSGTVYAISTLGGIITTFAVGFYTLPNFGITNTLYFFGILTMGIANYFFVSTKTFNTNISLIIIAACLSYNFQSRNLHKDTIYNSEGILGEIKVVERSYLIDNKTTIFRELLVNNISQTVMNVDKPSESYWEYVDLLTKTVVENTNKSNRNALLLGLGGGTLYKQLKQNNFNVDVVEIDGRIAKISKEYFGVDKNQHITVDDGRHFINTTTNKYDVVIFDLYNSETPPPHLMTKEAFKQITNRLNSGGILLINFYGYIKDLKGRATVSVYKTLLDVGLNTNMIATSGEESQRNIILLASNKSLLVNNTISPSTTDFNNAVVLIDNKPLLEKLYAKAALEWRTNYNKINTAYFME